MDEFIGRLAAEAGSDDAVGTTLTALGPGMRDIQRIVRERFRFS